MKTTRSRVLAAALVIAVVTAGVIVKLKFYPSAREADFAMNPRSLQQAGAGLVVVRPTRFARSHFNGIISAMVPVSGKPVPRLMGRNVTFKDLLAAAYGQSASRVALPAGAPKTNFDFLVTVPTRQRERLQEAILQRLGFVARLESHDADVLALKVENAQLPGLTASGDDKKEGAEFKDGRLFITHARLGGMTEDLERMLGTPVVDRTGLTNPFDFSLAWDPQVQQQLQNGPAARGVVDKMLKEWGLALKPDTATLEMLVVRKAD